MIKFIRKSILITPSQNEMLPELVNIQCARSESEIFRQALLEYARKIRPSATAIYLADLAKRRGERKVKEDVGPNMSIVNKLYGAKTEDGMCTIPLYTLYGNGQLEKGQLQIPIEQVTEELVANQFEGDKEKIIKILTEEKDATVRPPTKNS